jgi:hypothetical protein
MRVLDKDIQTDTLDDGKSQTVSVDTGDDQAEHVMLMVDDGDQDTEPSEYDIIMRVAPPTASATYSYRFVEEWADVTTRSWSWLAWPESMQVEITNTSGEAAQTYRSALICVGLP